MKRKGGFLGEAAIELGRVGMAHSGPRREDKDWDGEKGPTLTAGEREVCCLTPFLVHCQCVQSCDIRAQKSTVHAPEGVIA